MNRPTVLLAATLLLAPAAFAAPASEQSFTRTLPVNAAPEVTVLTGAGSIRIQAGDDRAVHIAGRVHSNSGWSFNGHGSDAEQVRQIASNPPITQSGNTITIGERHASSLFRNISIDYVLTLPRASIIAASTGSGDIDILDAGASLKAQSGSGAVHAQGIHGPATLGSGSGDIVLQQTGPGDVKAETGSGSIHLAGVNAALNAGTGSGDIEVSGQPGSEWRLHTGSGAIRLNLGSSARFALNAETGSGSIHTAQPISMQGELDRHHVSGTVNGGGPTLRASTGSGDIDIR